MTGPEEEDGTPGELKKGYLYEAEFTAKRIRELMRTAPRPNTTVCSVPSEVATRSSSRPSSTCRWCSSQSRSM